jgi:hypothetical protein
VKWVRNPRQGLRSKVAPAIGGTLGAVAGGAAGYLANGHAVHAAPVMTVVGPICGAIAGGIFAAMYVDYIVNPVLSVADGDEPSWLQPSRDIGRE